MIHHLSLPAENPAHVAEVLAEIFNGKATMIPDSDIWATWANDEFGTAIEVFPYGFKMQPGETDQPVKMDGAKSSPGFIESHAAISIERSAHELQEIASREGWQAGVHDRGPFRVVEFWLENRVLIEFLTPEMREEYTRAIKTFVSSNPE